jgi:hypothetical protein
MAKGTYTLSKEQRGYFTSVLLLERVNEKGGMLVSLPGDLQMLSKHLEDLAVKGWLDIKGTKYQVSEGKGTEVLTNFLEKLNEFRKVYSLYSAVDMQSGEFAFSTFFDFDSDEEFNTYIEDERFSDLRVAICQFKEIDPLEVILLDFMDRDSFDIDDNEWEAELTSGLIFDDIVEIANNSLQLLTINESQGEEAMEMVLEQGAEVMGSLLKEEKEMADLAEEEDEEDDEDFDEDVIEETTTTVEYIEEPVYDIDYYDSYYDPYYVSPCWGIYYY